MPPRPDWRWLSLRRIALLPVVVALLLVLGGVLAVHSRTRARGSSPSVPAVWATDINGYPPGALRLGEQVPPQPFEGQKTPPCEPRLERQVRGGCWVELKAEPPCPSGAFEDSGRCLLPVRRAEKPRTSLGR